MSEELPPVETEGDPAPEITPEQAEKIAQKKGKKQFLNEEGKFRPSEKLKGAILEVSQRVRAGWKPEYKVVAAKHGVKQKTLMTMMGMMKRGKLELSAPPAHIEDKKIALATETERSSQNLLKYEALLNESFEALIKKAKAENKLGNYLAFDQIGIPRVMQQLQQCRVIRNAVEKGNFAALERMLELHAQRKAQAENALPPTANITVNNNTVNVHSTPQQVKTPIEVLTGEQASIRAALGPIAQANIAGNEGE